MLEQHSLRLRAANAICLGYADALEHDAALAGINAARPGDLVVMCVDDAAGVYRSVLEVSRAGGRGVAIADPGELDVEEG